MTTTSARLLQDGQVLQVAHAASSTTRPGLTYDDHDRPRDADPGDVPRFTSPGATIGFDAIGGGKLTGQILTAMEAALRQAASAYSLYGSTTRKRVYIYGALDPGPTEISRSFGLSWDVGDWQVTPFLAEVGPEVVQRLRARVVAELKTTFASSYSQEISLAQALNIDTLRDYRPTATGEKYLITPNKAL